MLIMVEDTEMEALMPMQPIFLIENLMMKFQIIMKSVSKQPLGMIA